MELDKETRNEIKLIVREALKEHDAEKFKQETEDKDLISTGQAYDLRGEYRVRKLIKSGKLKRIVTGDDFNSTKYISKKALLALDGRKP